jgi:predicted dienelactone hydrolase
MPRSHAIALAFLAGGLAAFTAPAHAATLPVGHAVQHIVVAGSAQGEQRSVDVHLWYPAAAADAATRPKALYTSALYGRPTVPELWDPLSWTVEAEIAREGAAVDPAGKPFPVIVFSHGNTNDPIDYAHTLELIASAGFVVAAPYHTNNTQDDTRIDFINAQAAAAGKPAVFPCNDGRPGPCSRLEVPFSMADRVRDISAVLNALPGWLPGRVDMARVGALGHSRGTVSVLAAAGGSAPPLAGATCQAGQPLCWPLAPDGRIQAVMGMAIGALPITLGINFAGVKVPTVLVSGALDQMSPPAVSRTAFDGLSSPDKTFVSIPNAVHRSFDSTYCDQLQAAGSIAFGKPRKNLDQHTFDRIAINAASGSARDYCSPASFVGTSIDGTVGGIPSTGLDSDALKLQMVALAVSFFTDKLAHAAGGGVGGTVPATLSLALGSAASFGAFTPGLDHDYDTTSAATVTSTAGDATLSVTDPSAVATGRLVNGAFALGEPLQARVGATPFAPLGSPVTLLTYAAPVSNAAVAINFRQHIASTQALRTGTYSKTLTFTLSTTTP